MADDEIDPWSLDAIVSEAEEVAFKEQQEAEERARNEAVERKKAEEQAARQAKAKLQAEQESAIQAELDAMKEAEDRLYAIQEQLPDAQGQQRKDLKAALIKADKECKTLRGGLSKDARKRYASQASAAAGNQEPKDFDDPEKDAEMERQLKEEEAARTLEAAKEKQLAEEKAAYEAMKKKQEEEVERRRKEEEESEAALAAKRADGFSYLDGDDRPTTNDTEYTDKDIVDDYLLSALRLNEKGGQKRKSLQAVDDPQDEFAEDPQMQTLRSYVRRKSIAEEQGKPFGHMLQREAKEPPKEPETCCEKFLACYCSTCCKRIQKPAQKIVKSKIFNNFILILILLNCVSLALYEPDKDEDEGRNVVLNLVDKAFTGLFTIEMALKWTAFGIGPYFQDGWNILDFLCVVVGLVSFVPGAALGNLSGLRSVRALRPLRTLNAVPGIKMLVGTIFNAAPLLKDVLMLIFFLLFLFAIVALQFFAGKLRSVCMSESTGTAKYTTYSYSLEPEVCGSCGTGYRCQETTLNPEFGYLNFDNTGSSMLAIFVVMTQDGWVDIMYEMMDTTADFSFMYFVLIILLLCIISINLIAAILASRFGLLRVDQEQREEMEKALKMKAEDKPDLMSALSKAQELAAQNAGSLPILEDERSCWEKFRFAFFRVVTTEWFQTVSGLLILLYCIMLCVKHAGQSAVFDDILEYGDMGFSAIFLAELILKLIGYPWSEYFSSAFNIFDAIIIVFCFVDTYIVEAVSDSIAVLRLFRVFRVFQASRLLARFDRFWRVVGSIQHTLNTALWFNLLLFLVVFIYALLTMQLLPFE